MVTVDSIDELEEQLTRLIKERKDGKLSDLRQYHKILLGLDQEVLESIFSENWSKRSFFQKPKPGYAERMGLIFVKYPNAYKQWDERQEKQLAALYAEGKAIEEISEIMQRQKGGLRSRLKKLGLLK